MNAYYVSSIDLLAVRHRTVKWRPLAGFTELTFKWRIQRDIGSVTENKGWMARNIGRFRHMVLFKGGDQERPPQ